MKKHYSDNRNLQSRFIERNHTNRKIRRQQVKPEVTKSWEEVTRKHSEESWTVTT